MVYTLRDGHYRPALLFGRIARQAHWETASHVVQTLNHELESLSEEGQNSKDLLASFWCQQYILRVFPVEECYLTTSTVVDGVRSVIVPPQQPIHDTVEEMIPFGLNLPDGPVPNEAVNVEQEGEDGPADNSDDESDSDYSSGSEIWFDD